jgi:hypothetical protein
MGQLKWNPNAKKQSRKAEIATARNMNKFRLTGIALNTRKSVVTDREKFLIKEMLFLRDTIIANWDEESKKLGMKVDRYILLRRNERFKDAFQTWKAVCTKQEINFLTAGMDENDYKYLKL